MSSGSASASAGAGSTGIPPSPPDVTFGRYKLLERLGEGGMAEVFKAKSFGVEGFEKVLVIKRILPKLAEHPRFVDMFVHEAKLAVRLSHANIVQVFDLGRVDHAQGQPTSYFIAMEYVPGLDLATLLARGRRQKWSLPLGMAVFVAAEVAKALDHAHRRRDEQARPLGIVHRDISPQNILLSWEGEVKVTDFGIAKAKDSIAESESEGRAGRVRGKLAYMSPEQSRAGALDGRSDIFSLGTVLYEMIAGSNPFVGPTSFETQRRLQASEYPPLELLRAECPPALVEIVGRMLARRPEDRFADAGRLHEALLGFFYASGERFGGNKLAELLEHFHEDRAAKDAAEIEGDALFDEKNLGNERTPVEVPNPNQQASGLKPTTGNLFPKTGTGEARAEPLLARPADIGERREVTALVLTFFGQNREDSQTGARVVASRAKDVLARYGALLLEEEASHLVALFGLGDADGRDTEAAVRAALVILRARGGGVSVSAGAHVARVLVDTQGALIRDERVASLLAVAQSLARATEGQVAVSRLAARIVRNVFTTDDLPGAGTTAPEGSRIIASARSPSMVYGRFVGRHDELKRLGDILAAATRRKAQIVTIQGDKGIGKTRMVAEMERRLAKGNYNVGFYTATCPKNGADVRWSGLAAMLRVLCGVQEGDDEARVLEVLPRLRALGLHSDESTAVLAQLGALVTDSSAHPGSASRPPRGDVSVGLAGAFSRMVHGLCDDRLHVFVFDDAHAMDPATLDVLLAVAGRGHRRGESVAPPSSPSSSPGLRAVFMLATRDAVPEALARRTDHHHVLLDELSEEDAARLIGTRVGARVLLPELLAFCRERAGGHPLFLEELIKELTDSGAVSVLNGTVRARLDGETAVPRTLRTLIAGRVSRLDPGDRAILQASAILGEPILTEVLATLTKQSVAQITRAASNLIAKDLMRVTGPAQMSFASPMHGEIVLDAIPPEARRELHAAAAQAFITTMGDESLEASSGERDPVGYPLDPASGARSADRASSVGNPAERAFGAGNPSKPALKADHAERIGNHLYEAGDRDRAAAHYARAAFHKLRVSQLEPAIRLFTRALDLCDHEQRPVAEIATWLSALADSVARVRASPDLRSLAARVLPRIDAAGELAPRVVARVDLARAMGSVNQFDDAHQRLEEAFALAGDDRTLLSPALVAEMEVAARAGEFSRATRALERLEALGPLDSSRALTTAAFIRGVGGEAERALAHLDAAERIDSPDDLIAASDREKQRVLVYFCKCDFQAAADASPRAIDIARAGGLRYDASAGLHNLGDACRRIGDLPRAYAALTESKEIAESLGNERLVTLDRIHLAYLDGVGGVADADKLLRDLIGYAESRGYLSDAREGRLLLGAILTKMGAKGEARRELEKVLAMAVAQSDNAQAEECRELLAALG